jgi:site-specific recombinase XerD
MNLPEFFTPDQYRFIVERARHEPRDLAILLTLWSTALRSAELRLARVRDFAGDRLFVAFGKGHRQRWVPLSPEAQAAVRAYLAGRGPVQAGDPLFVTEHGRAFSRSGLYKLVRGYYEWAGFEPAGPHKARHSAATNFMNQGLELHETQALLGHAWPTTTVVYTHTATDRLFARYQARVGSQFLVAGVRS